jgi:hypothetical protein
MDTNSCLQCRLDAGVTRRNAILGFSATPLIGSLTASDPSSRRDEQDVIPAKKPIGIYRQIVVVRRIKNGMEIAGVLPIDTASGLLRRIAAKSPGTKAGERAKLEERTRDTGGDIEFWMVGDGVLGTATLDFRTRNVYFPTLRQSLGIPSEQFKELRTEIDSLQGITMGRAVPASGSASHPTSPYSLGQMCSSADMIVVGKAVSVLRVAPTPMNLPNSSRRHTVIAVVVDNVLKQFEPLASPVIKVRHVGGEGVRINREGKAVPFQSVGDPMLVIGNRYVLFLKSILAGPEAERAVKKGYTIANIDGVEGPAGELDEMWLIHGLAGHFLVKDGVLSPPNSETRGWRFHFGPQLMGLPLNEAVSLIRKELANPARP